MTIRSSRLLSPGEDIASRGHTSPGGGEQSGQSSHQSFPRLRRQSPVPSFVLDLQGVQVAQTVKRLPTMWDTQVRSLGWEDPLEKEMATHSSTLAWKMP